MTASVAGGAARRARRRAILTAIAIGLVASNAWAAPTLTVDMPSQPLSQALLSLSRLAKVTVIIPAELTRGRRAPAVRGRMEPAEAVRRLLEGAPLDFTIDADGAITIKSLLSRQGRLAAPPPGPAAAALEVARVSAVQVQAPAAVHGALWLKRSATPSSDFLLDNDLRGLPEAGLAGAMHLLPGVGVTRDAGEGRQVSVRGVGGEFTRVRINGMEALATFGGAYAGGGTNRGRGFDFNVFPSDLFKQIRVQKTASADIDEGSLGATVDLRTRSPFDAKPGLQLVAEAGYGAASQTIRPRLSAIASRTSDDGRLGVLLSASYARRSVYDVGYGAALWQTGETLFPGFGSSASGAPSVSALNAALHPRIPRVEAVRNEQARLGLSGSLQWRPSDQTEVVLDTLYARLDADRSEDLLGTFTFRTAGACRAATDPACGLAAVSARQATIIRPRPDLPVVIAGVFDNVDVRVESRRDRLETIFRQTTLRVSHRLSPSLRVEALGGFSRSDFSNSVQDTVQLEQYDVQGFAYDFRDRAHPRLDFGTAALETASAWRLAEVRTDPNWVDNSFKTFGLDLEWTPSAALVLRAGVLHKAYHMEAVSLGRSDGTIANQYAALPAFLTDLDPSQYLHPIRLDARTVSSPRPLLWLGPDVEAAMRRFRAECEARGCAAFDLGPEPSLGLNYTVDEQDRSAYAQLRFELPTPWTLRGDLGLRYAHTRQVSRGLSLDATAPDLVTPVGASRDYDNLLPSINLVAEPRPDLVLRLAAAKVMARPDLRGLRPGVSISTVGLRTISRGAPFQRPSRADTLDVAVEWYFARQAYLSTAMFHKTLNSGLTAQSAPAVFSQNPFGLPDSVATTACGQLVGCAADLPIWQFPERTDTGGGVLNGLEMALQAPLAPLARPLEGWSVRAAMTLTRSRFRHQALDGAKLVAKDNLGTPRTVSSLGLIYRKRRLDLRATLAHRGRYLTSIPGPTGGDGDAVAAATSLEASARYQVSPGLWITASGANLSDTAQSQYSDQSRLFNYLHHTGREFRVGLEMRF